MTDPNNISGVIDMYCDEVGCESVEEFEGFDGHVDFTTASRDACSMGWVIFNTRGSWHHLCPRHKKVDQSKF